MFAYNCAMKAKLMHPASRWSQDAGRALQTPVYSLRLAAMAGHMRIDKIAARRAALIDLLADGRPHPREEIWRTISAQLAENCWGKVPQETLARDLAALRLGGIRIAYSRRPETEGYYLQYPAVARSSSPAFQTIEWELVAAISKLSTAEKNERTFAAAEFALRQKMLILAEEHVDWSSERVEAIARRIVYGVGAE